MPKRRLTAKGVEKLEAVVPEGKTEAVVPEGETEPVDTDYWDETLPGFGVRVSARTGARTFIVRYLSPVTTKHRRYKLGRFHPERFTLAIARNKAWNIQQKVQAGEDPQIRKEEQRVRGTLFRDMVVDAIRARNWANEKTTRERIQLLDRELTPWHDRHPKDVTRKEVRQLLQKIVKEGKGVTANRTLRLIQLLYNQWLDDREPGVEGNPATRMSLPYEEVPRTRALTPAEIKLLWQLRRRGPP